MPCQIDFSPLTLTSSSKNFQSVSFDSKCSSFTQGVQAVASGSNGGQNPSFSRHESSPRGLFGAASIDWSLDSDCHSSWSKGWSTTRSKPMSPHRWNSTAKLSLVLDLDETLLHTETSVNPDAFRNFSFSFCLSGLHYFVYLRPGVREFLRDVNEICDILIYSNGTRAYVETAVSRIFEDLGTLVPLPRIFARQFDDQPPALKTLARCATDPSRTIIVDDRMDVWRIEDTSNLYQISAFHPSSFFGLFEDSALSKVSKMLSSIHHSFISDRTGTSDLRDLLASYLSSGFCSGSGGGFSSGNFDDFPGGEECDVEAEAQLCTIVGLDFVQDLAIDCLDFVTASSDNTEESVEVDTLQDFNHQICSM